MERMPSLQCFFEINPNIRRFSTSANIVSANENWMKESNIQLDQLDVAVDVCFDIIDVFRSLKILFESGFYKRLKLNVDTPNKKKYSPHILNGLDALSLFFGDLQLFVATPCRS